MYRRYDEGDFIRVRSLNRLGMKAPDIARLLRMPRSTVQRWMLRDLPPRGVRSADGFRPSDDQAYAYLLGVYLGDGHIFRTGPGSWRLGITLDAVYPHIVDEVAETITRAYPTVRPRRNRKPGSVLILASGVDWPAAFPQHGPGRKHDRAIELADWQSEIAAVHPRALLRGLIHSDGCRCVNRFMTRLPSGRVAAYEYPRYFFSNLSADIRAIFCKHCDLVGLRWTQSNPRNISISHRKSTEILDLFVGPKT